MKFQHRMKILKFPYNRHFFQTWMKIWYYIHVKILFTFFKINMATLQARFKLTNDKLINLIKYLQEFASSYVKLSFLNIDITLTCWSITNFNFFVECSHLCFDLFLPRFQFSLLAFIKFPIYPRLLYLNLGWNFSYTFFHPGTYRVEISTWDEDLHIISP